MQLDLIESFKISLGQLSEEANAKDRNIQELSQKYETQLQEFIQLQEQTFEHGKLKSTYEILQSQHELVTDKFSKLTSRYEDLKKNFIDEEKLRIQLEKNINQYKEESRNHVNDTKELRKKLNQIEEKYDIKKTELEKIEEKNSLLISKINSLEEEFIKLIDWEIWIEP